MKVLRTNTEHAASVYTLTVGSDRASFFSGAGDKFVVKWNSDTLQQQAFAVKLEQPVFSILHIPAFQLLVIGTSQGDLHVVDLVEKKEIRHFTTHRLGIYSLLFHEKEKQLIVAAGDGSFSIWHLPSFELIRHIPLGEFKLRALALTVDGYQLAIACGDEKIRIFETFFYNEIYTLQGHKEGVTSLCYHPTKNALMSGGKDGLLKVWNTKEDYKLLLELPAHYSTIYHISFSPNKKNMLTTSRDKSYKLWDAETLEVKVKQEASGTGHTHSVNAALWLDDEHFITAGDDRKITLNQID